MRRFILPVVVAVGVFGSQASAQSNACDLAAPFGTVDVGDVQAAIGMLHGISPCTADIGGGRICNVAVVQRVINAALPGGTCNTNTGVVPHSVTLTWTGPASSVAGYRIYRANAAGGPYSALNTVPVSATTYVDYLVRGGITYYYVARAVDAAGTESTNSNEAPAAVTAP